MFVLFSSSKPHSVGKCLYFASISWCQVQYQLIERTFSGLKYILTDLRFSMNFRKTTLLIVCNCLLVITMYLLQNIQNKHFVLLIFVCTQIIGKYSKIIGILSVSEIIGIAGFAKLSLSENQKSRLSVSQVIGIAILSGYRYHNICDTDTD